MENSKEPIFIGINAFYIPSHKPQAKGSSQSEQRRVVGRKVVELIGLLY